MAKRFTDSEKWDDPFFFELTAPYKLVWLYLLDKCNHAGIYSVNMRMMSFCTGSNLSETVILQTFKGRVMRLTNRKWFITKFLDFQYGKLNPKNRVHASAISLLNKEGLSKDLERSIQGLKDKEKDKDKDKDKEQDKDSDGPTMVEYSVDFTSFWNQYPKKDGKSEAWNAWQSINPMPKVEVIVTQVIRQAATKEDWKKDNGRWIPLPAKWLKDRRWEDEGTVGTMPQVKPFKPPPEPTPEDRAASIKAAASLKDSLKQGGAK